MAMLSGHYKYDMKAITTVSLIKDTYLVAVYHNGDGDSFVKRVMTNQV